MFFFRFYWTSGGSWKDLIKLGLSVLPSFCPDVFLELDHQFLLNFGIALENHFKSFDGIVFFKKKFCWKRQKCAQNGPKIGFFEFIERFGSLIYSEFGLQQKFILSALLLHKTHIRKYLVPEKWTKMLLAIMIFKSIISQGLVDVIALVHSVCWYKFMQI